MDSIWAHIYVPLENKSISNYLFFQIFLLLSGPFWHPGPSPDYPRVHLPWWDSTRVVGPCARWATRPQRRSSRGAAGGLSAPFGHRLSFGLSLLLVMGPSLTDRFDQEHRSSKSNNNNKLYKKHIPFEFQV